jgi:Phosphodiester glycosidase
MTGSWEGPGFGTEAGPRQVPTRSESKAARTHLQMERRRRKQRRRLVPLVLVVAVVAGVVAWRVGGGGGGGASGDRSASSVASTSTTTTLPPPYVPPAITPVISPALAGEGQWTAADAWSGTPSSVMTTTFRPDPSTPSIVAYATWMRTATTQLALYLGYEGPGPTTLDRGAEMVPVAARSTLLATFNSGFYEKDSAAGFFVNGTLYFPMIDGLATVVTYTNGTVDVVNWQGGPTPGPNVVMARQNLSLLVDNHAATPGTAVGSNWGITLGGVPAVWRTGLGIDAQGNLMYVAAPEQTAASLAQILIDMGAVRAMQLDINPEWPIFVTYGGPGAAAPALYVPNPNQISNRFLYSSTKDFFAVYERVRGVTATAQPWS